LFLKTKSKSNFVVGGKFGAVLYRETKLVKFGSTYEADSIAAT
jgi:hypothetical protein